MLSNEIYITDRKGKINYQKYEFKDSQRGHEVEVLNITNLV